MEFAVQQTMENVMMQVYRRITIVAAANSGSQMAKRVLIVT
jgi:hypothetical protein